MLIENFMTQNTVIIIRTNYELFVRVNGLVFDFVWRTADGQAVKSKQRHWEANRKSSTPNEIHMVPTA